jgi:anti-sigma regulatory factor (Ser/Thr protein kinase)
MHFIGKFRSMYGSETDIEIALNEALENAVVHGNGEDHHKRVYVTCRCTRYGEVSITVQDEGQGFDTGTLPDPNRNGKSAAHFRPWGLSDESVDGRGPL